jgi:DNA-binding MarR family transcriptional regulator
MFQTKTVSAGWTAPARLPELAEFRYRLRRFLAFSEVAAEAAGISAQQYQLLQVVSAVPVGQECSISYVAERMVVRHNSAVELVDRAEKSGLVRRVADESDHRRSLVEITERGGELVSRLVVEHLTEIEAEGPELLRTLHQLIRPRTVVGRGETKKAGAGKKNG